ncbi:MAG: LPP20 family lipoprotein [Planctomycetota bacterium]
MRFTNWLRLLLLLVVGAGCGTTSPDSADPGPTPAEPPPRWITHHPEDPEFPRGRYLTGLGAADERAGGESARRAAEEQARAEIARTLRTEIRSVLQTYLRTITRNDTHTNTEMVSERIESTTDVEFQGAELVRSWPDPETGYVWVKVVLSKPKYAGQLLARLQGGLSRIRAGREAASAANDVTTQLLALLGVYQESTERLGELAQLAAVVDQESPAMAAARQELLEAATSTFAEVTAIRGAIEFTVTSGNDQDGLPGGALPQPIVVRAATASHGPLSGFPVRFSFPPSGIVEGLDGSSVTDAAGTAECTVARIPTAGLVAPRVEARLDFETVAPAFPPGLVPRAEIRFRLPTLSGARVAMTFSETNTGSPSDPSVVGSRVAEVMTRRGARLVEEANGALTADGPKYVVRGNARAIPRPRQTFYFSYAEANVQFIDVESGTTLLSIRIEPNGTVKGADVNSQEQAGIQALARLGDLVATELDRRLRALFTE